MIRYEKLRNECKKYNLIPIATHLAVMIDRSESYIQSVLRGGNQFTEKDIHAILSILQIPDTVDNRALYFPTLGYEVDESHLREVIRAELREVLSE